MDEDDKIAIINGFETFGEVLKDSLIKLVEEINHNRDYIKAVDSLVEAMIINKAEDRYVEEVFEDLVSRVNTLKEQLENHLILSHGWSIEDING